MKIRFFADAFDKFPSEINATAAPREGDLVSIDGVVRKVESVRWDFWSWPEDGGHAAARLLDGDPIVNVYLLEHPLPVRGPKPSLKKAKGKPR